MVTLKSTKVFDYEDTIGQNSVFSFLVVARDKCGEECSLTRAVSVTVQVNDLNDNSPAFKENLPTSPLSPESSSSCHQTTGNGTICNSLIDEKLATVLEYAN